MKGDTGLNSRMSTSAYTYTNKGFASDEPNGNGHRDERGLESMSEIDLNDEGAGWSVDETADAHKHESSDYVNFDANEKTEVALDRPLGRPADTPGRLRFVDFPPQPVRKKEWWSFTTQYEVFSQLFDKVNEWLRMNPTWRVKSIETVLYDASGGFAAEKSFFNGKTLKRFKRGVRLWLLPRKIVENQAHDSTSTSDASEEVKGQKVGCINVVPRHEKKQEADGTIGDKYERLDEMLVRVNHLLIHRPINGRIINLECVELPIEEGGKVDTEACHFPDWDSAASASPLNSSHLTSAGSSLAANSSPTPQYVHILRIYFEYGIFRPREVIHVKDFIPTRYMWDAPMAVANYESFASLLKRASQWIRQQQSELDLVGKFRYCSAATVESPLEESDFPLALLPHSSNSNGDDERSASGCKSDLVDSQKMFHHLKPYQSLLKFLRIAYTVPYQEENANDKSELEKVASDKEKNGHCDVAESQPIVLNCKVFTPTRARNKVDHIAGEPIGQSAGSSMAPEYARIASIRKHMEAWLTITGAKVLSIESDVIKLPYSSSSLATCVDSCLVATSPTSAGSLDGTHWLCVYRVYLDGHVLEPPNRLLPHTGHGNDASGGEGDDEKNCHIM